MRISNARFGFKKSRFPFLGTFLFLVLAPLSLIFHSEVVQAVVGVSSSELQAAAGIIVPAGSTLGQLEGYGDFSLLSKSNVNGGIQAVYEATFSDDPWLIDELPHLQLLVFSYGSQEDALAAFESYSKQVEYILFSDARNLFYESDKTQAADIFLTINAEYRSFHWLHANGNLLFQASIYRTNGILNEENLKTYAEAIDDQENVQNILQAGIDQVKGMLGILFPPMDADYSLNTESFSVPVSSIMAIPIHGVLSFRLYVSDPKGATGTILDSSGLSDPTEGDIFLHLQEDGRLFAGIYAPDFDADCDQQLGWYRIKSSVAIYPYEWNNVELHYGVGGFGVLLNGENVGLCTVSQPRSEKELYLGDFQDDSVAESMIGTLESLSGSYSLTDTGKIWDTVLQEQLFLDLPNNDPDVRIFEFLKEKGIFLGSNGMLHPDTLLNRAEMVKILLKAFNYRYTSDEKVPFWDVPSDAWYGKYLSKAYTIGMVEGHDDGSFLPGHVINKAEFFTMLTRMGDEELPYHNDYLDVEKGVWYEEGAAYAKSYELANGLFFHGSDVLSRRDAAAILYEIMQ